MENKNDKKTSRASQTREKTSQKKVWSPPSALDKKIKQHPVRVKQEKKFLKRKKFGLPRHH